jgi:putative FmdB family regulatory protein
MAGEPIYVEVVQSMKDDPITTCPDCEKETFKRVIVPGGGFRIGGLGVHKPTAHWGD